MEALEQLLVGAPTKSLESATVEALYSLINQPLGPMQLNPHVMPLERQFDRQTTLMDYGFGSRAIEGPGSILRNSYDMDQSWKLQERLDYSGHQGSSPHLNYDLLNPSGSVIRETPKLLKDMHAISLLDY